MDESSKTDDLSTTKMKDLLKYLESKALEQIKLEDYEEALSTLEELEQVLESMVLNGQLENHDYILSILYNSALCHQKLANLKETIEYLDGAIYNIINPGIMKTNTSSNKVQIITDSVRKNKFHCRMLIQLCVFKSQVGQHAEALKIARKAHELSIKSILDTLDIITQSEKPSKPQKSQTHKQLKHFDLYQSLLSPKRQQIFNTNKESQLVKNKINIVIQRSKPCVISLIKYIRGDFSSSNKCFPVDLRSPLGVESASNWIYEYSINEATTLVPISVKEIQQTYNPHYELSRDFMLDKVFINTDNITIFKLFRNCCRNQISEKRTSQNQRRRVSYKYSQLWHWKAVNLVKNFLPDKCPLVQHILDSFKKHYGEMFKPSSQLKQITKMAKKSISKSPRNIEIVKVKNRNSCRSPQLKINNFERIYTQTSPQRECFANFPEVYSTKNANQNKFPTLKLQQRTDYKEQLTERAYHEKNQKQRILQIKSEPFLNKQDKKSKIENDINPAKEYGQEYPMLLNELKNRHTTQLVDSNEENFGNISPIDQETIIINSFDLYGEQKNIKERTKPEIEEKKKEKHQRKKKLSSREPKSPKSNIFSGSSRKSTVEKEDEIRL